MKPKRIDTVLALAETSGSVRLGKLHGTKYMESTYGMTSVEITTVAKTKSRTN